MGRSPHPFLEIEGSSGQEQIDCITNCAFEIVAGHAKVMFQMAYDWFNGATPAKILASLAFEVFSCIGWWCAWQDYCRVTHLFSSTKSPVAKGFFW